MFKFLLYNQFQKVLRYYRNNGLAKIITSLLFLVVFVLVAYGIYLFLKAGFLYIYINEQSLEPFLLYVYEIFFLILGVIFFLSAMITGMFSLWKGKNDDWLVGSYSYDYLPKLVFIKSFLNGLWPLLIIAIPMVLALNAVFYLSVFSMLIILVFYVLYLLFVSALTLLFILAVARLYLALSREIKGLKFNFKIYFIILTVLVLALAYCVWSSALSLDVVELFQASDTSVSSVNLSVIVNNFIYLPSHIIAMGIFYTQTAVTGALSLYLVITLALSFLSVYLWFKLSKLYLLPWQKLKEGKGFEAGKKNQSKLKVSGFKFSGSVSGALFKRELLVYIRNPKNLTWFGFLLFIWLIQVAINYMLANTLNINDISPNIKDTAFQALSFVVAIYFISAFVLRFVFPAFSSERKTFWLLKSAPIDYKKIYYMKYLFFAVFFVIFGLALQYLSLDMLNLTWVSLWQSLSMFFVSILFITALGLSVGALFPNYETDDPYVMSTSLPGIFLLIGSLIYGSLAAFLIYSYQNTLNDWPIYAFIIISCALILALLIFTPKFLINKKSSRKLIS
ncbi:MAG: hypothetical protein K9M44_00500 [Candidatus Pacebacteria bacterium]|nr:hypothetical protein [Candidatus Paceibacterota bacterium]